MAISKVVVVDGNNLTVRIDRGVAGRGITDVQPIEIDNALYLEFFFSDGTTETVGPVGTIQYIGQAPIVVNASTISLSTVPVNLGGTGQVTANAGFNALAPLQTSNAGKYLKTDGTNAAWDLLDISTADITGVLPIANGGTNAATAADARTNLNAANQDTTISAGTGLSGGGSLAANRTISIANTAVTAASYGAASKTLTATVNAQGQLTALADTPIAIANTQISGLGTMSTQNANAVAITGGSITGITDLAVADGGTGASTAAGARTNLNAADQDITISAGTGLSGGGSLAANRTLSIANTAVTAGSYGLASNTLSATVNAQGQLTALAATPIAIANTQVSGLGTASVLDAAVALGAATLDAGGKVPLSQIPASIQGGVSYQGSWNATTNTPTLTSSVGSKGHYYVVSVAGSTNLNGITDWLAGDWAIFNGTAWEKIDNTDSVTSVNGYVGAVTLTAADVGAPPTTRTITAGTGLTGGGDLSANRTIGIDSTVVTLTGSQTLTNKTINLADNTLQATSAQIAAAVTDETGTGALVFADSPTLVTPALGTPSSGTVTNLTGTASININGTVGATTANTGAFTTLTTSSTVTHNGGTANGVAYLNGSKVLTTGSALTFDGTNLYTSGAILSQGGSGDTLSMVGGYQISANSATNGLMLNASSASGFINFRVAGAEQARLTSTGLGIGTSSPSTKLHVSGSGNQAVTIQSTNGGIPYIALAGTGVGTQYIYANVGSSQNITFEVAGSEQMRLTSTGLGIGTSSPTEKLEVSGNAAVTGTGYLALQRQLIPIGENGTVGVNFRWYSTGTTYTTGAAINATSAAAWTSTSAPARLEFLTTASGSTTPTIRATLDSSGNLGLGVTPSAWGSGQKALQVGNAALMQFNILDATYVHNAYHNGTNWIYSSSYQAEQYRQVSGQHQWFTAPSGTAGDAISFTQAMTLDASGSLLVGTTSNASGRRAVFDSGASTFVSIRSSTTGYSGLLLGDTENDGFGRIEYFNGDDSMSFFTNGTERARITSGGDLLVGTTSNAESARLNVQGGYIYLKESGGGDVYLRSGFGGSNPAIQVVSNSPLLFLTNNTERARIDSSGNLLIGTTSAHANLATGVQIASANWGLAVSTSAGAAAGTCASFGRSSDGNVAQFYYDTSFTSLVGSISVTATATAYNTSSDYRLKNITGPITTSGAYIDSLNPVEGTWKADGSTFVGLIAHEVQEASRTTVATGVKDGEEMQGMDYSSAEIIANLIAEVKSLRQRLAAAGI